MPVPKKKKDAKKQCKESIRRCCKKVDFSQKEMFSSMMTTKEWKKMKMKRVAINTTALLVLIIVIKVAYDFQPQHYKLVLPQESDLSINPKLRSVSTVVEYYDVRNQIFSTLSTYCEQHKDSYDILFCHNVQINSVPILSPCFMMCKSKEFFYDLEVIETDKKEQVICHESYATMTKRIKRNKSILIRGQTGMELKQFSTMPNSTLQACLYQHANDVSRGKWLQN